MIQAFTRATILSLTMTFFYGPTAYAGLASRIEDAALNGVANVVEKDGVRTLYGAVINGEDTGSGKYACARVVAATVNKAGEFIPRVSAKRPTLALAVWEVETFARGAGWRSISSESEVLPGDIVIYRKLWNTSGDCTDGGGACHVGIMTRQGLFQNHPWTSRPDLGGGGLLFYTFKTAYRPQD